jgi:autotransporter-associated beta strand protein
MKPSKNLFAVGLGLSVASISPFALGGNTWDGGGADNNWTTAENWNSDTLPNYTTALTFAGSSRLAPSNDLTDLTVAGFVFSSGAGAFNIGGNSITLGGNITNSSTNLQTINLAMATTAARTITLTSGGGNVTLAGNISGIGGNLTVAGATSATLIGTLTLSGNNSFTGGINTGGAAAIRLTTNTAAGTGTITIGTGSGGSTSESGRIELVGGITVSNAIAWSGRQNTVTSGILNVSGTNSLTGSVTNNAGGVSYQVESSAGLLNLGTTGVAWNTNTGRTFNFRGAGDVTVLGNIVGSTNAISKGGTGVLTLAGANTNTGNVSFAANSSGTIVLANTAAVQATNTVNFGALTGNTLNLATDSSVSSFLTNSGTGFDATIVSNRASAGAGITHNLGAATYGGGTLNIEAGSNVTSGTASLAFSSVSLTAGFSVTTTFNPTTANVSIGTVTIGLNNQVKTLGLGGTSSGNAVTGAITNGVGTVGLAKSGTSTWTLSGTNTYTGGTGINGGVLALGSSGAIGTTGTVSFGGGTLQFGANNQNDYSARIANGSGAIRIDTNGQNVTFGTGLAATNTGGLVKTGEGTLQLQGNSTYTGATIVSAGTLLVNGSLGNTAVSVDGGTLGGSGAIAGAVTVSSTLSPGTSIESLSTGALTMASGSSFAFEVANNSSTGADLVAVNGSLSLTNVTLAFDAATLAAFTSGSWLVGNKITLLSYSGNAITSGFNGYDDDASYFFGSNEWVFNYNDNEAGGNFLSDATANGQNRFVTMTLVPEPSSALLGALGLLALLRRRR